MKFCSKHLIKKVPFLVFFQSKKFLFQSKKFLFVSANYHKIKLWLCLHIQYICNIYILRRHKKNRQLSKNTKVNQKSEIFELLFINTRSKRACILIGANLLPGVFSLRSKKPICICSHSLTRKAYNRSLRSLNAFLSHLGVGNC